MEKRFPPGWDENRVERLIAHYDSLTEEEQVADDEDIPMTRAHRLYSRLDETENSFATQLRADLSACAQGKDDLLFCSGEFFPAHWPRNIPTQLADDLLQTVEEIRRLRKKAGEPFRGSLAWRFRQCCRQWADQSDSHRGSAQTIAKMLLAEVESQHSEPDTVA